MTEIKKLRKILKLTQQELANLTGFSQPTISRMSHFIFEDFNTNPERMRRILAMLKSLIENLNYDNIKENDLLSLDKFLAKYKLSGYFHWVLSVLNEEKSNRLHILLSESSKNKVQL